MFLKKKKKKVSILSYLRMKDNYIAPIVFQGSGNAISQELSFFKYICISVLEYNCFTLLC